MRREEAMTVVKAETAPYFEAFRARPHDLDEPRWLAGRREAALSRFGELGFPTRRQEAWRFTNLRLLQGTTFAPANGITAVAPAVLDALRLADALPRLVFVYGPLAAALALFCGRPP